MKTRPVDLIDPVETPPAVKSTIVDERPWRQYLCRACGLIYDEEKGDPDSGLPPGTRFEDIPDDWVCPLCGVVKADFEPYEPLVGCSGNGADAAVLHKSEQGVVIIGAGIAGWSVAEALRALDASLPITIVTACHGDRYHKPELSTALARGLDTTQLIRESGQAAARRLRVNLLAETFVVGITADTQQVRTTRGTLTYTHLVLAQGAKPRLPAALPASLCWRVNDLSGWSGLQAQLQGGSKQVAIVGAGMVGCELAEDMARAGHRVTLLDVNTHPLSGLLPALAGQKLQASLAALGVAFVGCSVVQQVAALADGKKRITTAEGVYDVDVVVAATGLATNPRLAQRAGLRFDQGIVVNPATLMTSVQGIYALGDCVSFDGMPCRFIEPLGKQAAAVASAITGRTCSAYAHSQPVIRLKTKSLPIVIHGQPRRDAPWQLQSEGHGRLVMEQIRNGVAVARLEVGNAQAGKAAELAPA